MSNLRAAGATPASTKSRTPSFKRKPVTRKLVTRKPVTIPDQSRFLTVAQVATLLLKNPKTIYRRAKKGLYPYVRDEGGQILFYRSAFEQRLAARTVAA